MPNPFLRLGIILTLLVLLTACALSPQEVGVLEGQVSIGPLVPVQREGEEAPTPAPEVYAAWEIVIYKKNGKTVIKQLQIQADGSYWTELPAGIYVIDINRIGIDSAEGLPQEIEILPDTITSLDIEIDTGIR